MSDKNETVVVHAQFEGRVQWAGQREMTQSEAKEIEQLIDSRKPLSMDTAADFMGAFRNWSDLEVEMEDCDEFRVEPKEEPA